MRRSAPPERTPGAVALTVRRGLGTGPAARCSLLLLALLSGGGLVTALAARRQVPPPAVHALAQRVADGAAVHAWLGVMTQDLTDSVAESLGLASAEGALIAAVMAGSPAHLAGLKPADVISAIDDVPVRSTADLSRLIGWAAPGDTLRLSIWRERSTRVVLVRIGAGLRTVGLDRAVPYRAHPRIECAQPVHPGTAQHEQRARRPPQHPARSPARVAVWFAICVARDRKECAHHEDR